MWLPFRIDRADWAGSIGGMRPSEVNMKKTHN